MSIPTIRHERMSDIFQKYHIDGLPFDSVIHHFSAPDEGLAHDHPFDFTSHILHGFYTEKIYLRLRDGRHAYKTVRRLCGSSHRVKATTIHQIISVSPGGCYTIMVPGPWKRKSGFWRFDEDGAKFREWDQQEFQSVKSV